MSFIGLKDKSPDIARAVTSSGDPTKANVFGLPSFRLAKFLLNDVIIVFFLSGSSECLAHCPIHGPQAFASTTPPIFSNTPRNPSLSTVYRTCSLPGVIVKSLLIERFLSNACCAILAERDISS